MTRTLPRRRKQRFRPMRISRLHVEQLETRYLPASLIWPGLLDPVAETEPNGTLDGAQNLGDLTTAARAEVVGTVGAGTAGAADVDWYSFTLDAPATVHVATLDQRAGSQLVSALSLYNGDPQDFADPYDPLGNRLLAQDDGAAHGGDAHLDRLLGPGAYYVAVSGSGDAYFNPYLAGSGDPGSTGAYGLLITATPWTGSPGDGPAVLTTDPAPAGAATSAPFAIRVDFSTGLDPTTVNPDQTVKVTFNPTGQFGDGNDQDVTPTNVNFSPAVNELQLFPAAPLAPGYYQVFLAGDNSQPGASVLADPSGNPLGMTALHPQGQDFTFTFQVTSAEGVAGSTAADDTPATAHLLGDVTRAGLVRVSGAIGDDPAYNPNSTDPNLANPAADVDLYQFHVSGPGNYAFVAEAFAGRIGSPLNPGLSLFRLNPTDGQLELVNVNSGSLNASQATNGTLPLYSDPVLYAGLTAGDYFLAISGIGNLPDPSQNVLPGTNGVFDPNVSHSGSGGFTTGPYVLNLRVQPVGQPPQVVQVTPSEGTNLDAPPTQLVVQCSGPVNLQRLAYETYQQTSQSELAAVYVQGSDGKNYHPRLISYDPTTDQATFLMLDVLPNGPATVHLVGSGPLGLTDLGGQPLSGNDPSGDYVVHFTVNGPARGTNGNPSKWADQEPNDTLAQAQNLGVLFPHELQNGVVIVRNATAGASDTADYYQIQILQSRDYILSLSGTNLPAGAKPLLFDANGNPLATLSQGNGGGVRVGLDPGTYYLEVGGWTSVKAPSVSYQLRISLGYSVENPVPLTVGPAPAYRVSLVSSPPAPPPANNPPPPVTTPPPAPTSAAPVTSTPPALVSDPPPAATTPPPPVTDPPPETTPPPAPAVSPPPPAPPSAPPAPPSAPPRVDLPVIPAGNPSPVVTVPAPGGAAVPSPAFVSADILAALRAVPVGGVRGPNAGDATVVAERVVLPGSTAGSPVGQFVVAQTLPGHIFLQGVEAPRAEGQPLPLPDANAGKVLEQSLRTLEVLTRAVDELFRGNWSLGNLQGWLRGLLGVSPQSKSVPETTGSVEAGVEEEDVEAQADRAALDSAENWAWMAALPMAGRFLPMDREQRRPSRVTLDSQDEERE